MKQTVIDSDTVIKQILAEPGGGELKMQRVPDTFWTFDLKDAHALTD